MATKKSFFKGEIQRKPFGKGFKYYRNGKEISDSFTLNRIENYKIPPYWKDVDLTMNPKSNILAIGYDKRGKRQYKYAEDFIKKMTKKKYRRLLKFSDVSVSLKPRIRELISQKEITYGFILGAMTAIIMNCSFRIGTKTGLKIYKSTGTSTLKPSHVKFTKGGMILEFFGKKQVVNQCTITDPYVMNAVKRLIKRCKDDKLEFLFYYVDDILSFKHINPFLKKEFGITSKDIRTWNANYFLVQELMKSVSLPLGDRKKRVKEIIEKKVAPLLSHTPAICKRNYIIPELTQYFLSGKLDSVLKKFKNPTEVIKHVVMTIL